MLAQVSIETWISVIAVAIAVMSFLLGRFVDPKASEVKALGEKIDALEAKLEASADRRIDEKFRAMHEQCAVRHQNLDKRLESGDRHFQESREAEKEMARNIAEIRERMATREDFTRLWDQLRGRNEGRN